MLCYLLSCYLGCKYRQNEFARMEGVENTSDNVEIGAGGNVGLEADITKLGFRCDVDCHIFS